MTFTQQRITHIIQLIKTNSMFELDPPNDFAGEYYNSVHVAFHKPGTKHTYFFGTYLNPFSCLDYDEEPEKTYLWIEETASEHPILELHAIYKHNGAKEDVSVDMIVRHNHFTVAPELLKLSPQDLNNPIFMRELKRSPTKIVGTPWINNCNVSTPFRFRIRKKHLRQTHFESIE